MKIVNDNTFMRKGQPSMNTSTPETDVIPRFYFDLRDYESLSVLRPTDRKNNHQLLAPYRFAETPAFQAGIK
ncbi:hypothetical protein HanHA300_Chr14g0537201 [Helianthus annuus]|nr:hypothetical protein HanHA300_Chr14g0537201 [Helianthus annuus]KAJ0486938.1 hypothetical protein HanHA89_Chr14g0585041 [Helianthus annuus]